MFEPKLPAVAAAVGFVLSFLIGLFSGASFPVFLFRALGMALIFGVGAAVVYAVMYKFLPELFDAGGNTAANSSARDTGQMVNVTIGDQDDISFSPFGPPDSDEAGHAATEYADQPYETLSDEEDVSDLQYQEDSLSEADQDQPVKPQTGKEPSGESNSSTGEREPSGTPDYTTRTAASKGSSSGLDILPDIQDFVPEEKVEEESDFDEELSISSTGTGFSVKDVGVDGIETETMARAIRTILAKDK